jgi:hypothetical protein
VPNSRIFFLNLCTERRETFVWPGIFFVGTPSSILALTNPLRRSDTAGAIDPSSKCWNDGFQLGSGVMNENVKMVLVLDSRFLAVENSLGANSFEPHCSFCWDLKAKLRRRIRPCQLRKGARGEQNFKYKRNPLQTHPRERYDGEAEFKSSEQQESRGRS